MSKSASQSTTRISPTEQHLLLLPQETAVRFITRHLFGLSVVAGSVRLLSGSVTVQDRELFSIDVELDMTSFQSASRARDKVVASPTLLHVVAHPRATYRSTGVEARDGGWLVHGELTVRGIAAPVDLLVDALDPAAGGRVHATARVDRFDHGITLPTAMAARHLQIDVTTRITHS